MKFVPPAAFFRRALRKTLGFSAQFMPSVRSAVENGLTVFTFHEVSDHPSRFAEQFGLAVSLETFRRQVCWIQSNFEVIPCANLLKSEVIPRRAAVISFDDGFLGSFVNGLAILEQLRVPAILFLNMQAVLDRKPILSAVACFLDRYEPKFAEFARSAELSRPFHLTLTPSLLAAFEKKHGGINQAAVIEYQGDFADRQTVEAWDGKELVAFGNHFFDHWNAAALSPTELEDQYWRNATVLSSLKSNMNLFAFTNGQPQSCYSDRDIAILKRLGAGKVFSAVGGVNGNPKSSFLLGRLGLTGADRDDSDCWFRVGRAVLDRRRSALIRHRASEA